MGNTAIQTSLDYGFADLNASNYTGTFAFGNAAPNGADDDRYQFANASGGLVMTVRYNATANPSMFAVTSQGLLLVGLLLLTCVRV